MMDTSDYFDESKFKSLSDEAKLDYVLDVADALHRHILRAPLCNLDPKKLKASWDIVDKEKVEAWRKALAAK